MGWQCCQCSHRWTDDQSPTCKAPCSHRKCTRCSLTVGKTALPTKSKTSTSKSSQQPAKPTNTACPTCGKPHPLEKCWQANPHLAPPGHFCTHCGKPHPESKCWSLHPELRIEKQSWRCSYCLTDRHTEDACWAKDPSKKPSAPAPSSSSSDPVGGRRSPKLCSNCGAWRHVRDECWKLHPEQNPYLNGRRVRCGCCGKAHSDGECWVLFPELRGEFYRRREEERGKGSDEEADEPKFKLGDCVRIVPKQRTEDEAEEANDPIFELGDCVRILPRE